MTATADGDGIYKRYARRHNMCVSWLILSVVFLLFQCRSDSCNAIVDVGPLPSRIHNIYSVIPQ